MFEREVIGWIMDRIGYFNRRSFFNLLKVVLGIKFVVNRRIYIEVY